MWGKGICLDALRGYHGPLPFTNVVKEIISKCSIPLPHPTPREAIAFFAVIITPHSLPPSIPPSCVGCFLHVLWLWFASPQGFLTAMPSLGAAALRIHPRFLILITPALCRRLIAGRTCGPS